MVWDIPGPSGWLLSQDREVLPCGFCEGGGEPYLTAEGNHKGC